MSEVTVRIQFRAESGAIEDTGLDFPLSTFAGVLPSIGDAILDPGVLQGEDRSHPASRRIWSVVGRVFNPRDLEDYVALIVEERTAQREDAAFIP